jgi:hypothetical protein
MKWAYCLHSKTKLIVSLLNCFCQKYQSDFATSLVVIMKKIIRSMKYLKSFCSLRELFAPVEACDETQGQSAHLILLS